MFEYNGYIFNRTRSFYSNCIRISTTYFDENNNVKCCFNDVHENLTHKLLEPILDDMIEKVEEDIKPKWKRMLEGTPMGKLYRGKRE